MAHTSLLRARAYAMLSNAWSASTSTYQYYLAWILLVLSRTSKALRYLGNPFGTECSFGILCLSAHESIFDCEFEFLTDVCNFALRTTHVLTVQPRTEVNYASLTLGNCSIVSPNDGSWKLTTLPEQQRTWYVITESFRILSWFSMNCSRSR